MLLLEVVFCLLYFVVLIGLVFWVDYMETKKRLEELENMTTEEIIREYYIKKIAER